MHVRESQLGKVPEKKAHTSLRHRFFDVYIYGLLQDLCATTSFHWITFWRNVFRRILQNLNEAKSAEDLRHRRYPHS